MGPRPTDQLHPTATPIPIGELCKELYADSLAVNARRFKAMQEELNFCQRFQHWRYDRGLTTDQRLVQPHAPELFDLVRQKTGSILEEPQYIEARPQNPGDDLPGVAEDTKLALEHVLHNPQFGFPRCKRRAVIGMLAARSWVIAADVVHGIGAYGKEIVFRTLPRWRFHIAPGWQDMHDLTCPWVAEDADMRIGDIRRMARYGWINTEKVKADGQASASPGSTAGHAVPLGTPNAVDFAARDPLTARASETETAKIVKFWFRYDDETYEVPREDSRRPMPREMWFQQCPLCDHATAPGHPVDDQAQVTMCPACGKAPLIQVSDEFDVDVFAKYPDGRLVIVAVNQVDPETGKALVLFDGAWPYKMRTFPYAHYRCYEDPVEQDGQGDTSIHWWSILILNGLRRFGWEQMRRNVDLMVALRNKFQDAQGRPWTFTDLHGQVAYTDDLMGLQGIRHFQGSGIPQSLIPFHEMMSAPFKSAQGTEDLDLTQEQSRDIPVGTVRQLSRIGSIPARMHREIIDEEDSLFFGAVVDLLSQCWGPERAVQVLGQQGEYRLRMIKQSALSNLQVVVTASPKLSAIRTEEMSAFVEWTRLMAADPAAGILVARGANIPMSYVRDYLKNRGAMASVGSPTSPGGTPAPGGPGMNGGNPPIANGAGSLSGAR